MGRRDTALVRPGVLALSSNTYAYDDDGKKQHDFHGEKLHQGCGGAMDSADRVIAVDWSANRKLYRNWLRAKLGVTLAANRNSATQ
jgi:hypothetical protein